MDVFATTLIARDFVCANEWHSHHTTVITDRDKPLKTYLLERCGLQVTNELIKTATFTLSANSKILARDWLVLSSLNHIDRTESLSIDFLFGKMWMLTDLRSILGVSSCGSSNESIIKSFERLNDIEFTFKVKLATGEIFFPLGDSFKIFMQEPRPNNSVSAAKRSREWSHAFSEAWRLFTNYAIETKFDMESLASVRRNPVALALAIHKTTKALSVKGIFKSKIKTIITTFMPFEIDDWGMSPKLRNNLLRKLQRAASLINAKIENRSQRKRQRSLYRLMDYFNFSA
ncbi:hypothetical protein V6259_18060 [Marinomonas sp. TI.3.20]|uniref:hypothetical protein n=1 Tax=Marinomonas sp. TI.3.20 TaxID=3121296 RepID=UPI00311EED92